MGTQFRLAAAAPRLFSLCSHAMDSQDPPGGLSASRGRSDGDRGDADDLGEDHVENPFALIVASAPPVQFRHFDWSRTFCAPVEPNRSRRLLGTLRPSFPTKPHQSTRCSINAPTSEPAFPPGNVGFVHIFRIGAEPGSEQDHLAAFVLVGRRSAKFFFGRGRADSGAQMSGGERPIAIMDRAAFMALAIPIREKNRRSRTAILP